MTENAFQRTSLWRQTLGEQGIECNDALRGDVERLRNAFMRFRQNASYLAQQISADLRSLTVHDITHIDALWEIASTVIDPDCDLNPLEGFLLGSAFLMHDLGLALCSYPHGVAELQKDGRWQDIVVQKMANRDGLAPIGIDSTLIPADIAGEATESLLRQLHAERAEMLPSQEFTVGNDRKQVLFLLEDQDLRLHFAELIGRLAYSHWWSIDKVEYEFNFPIGTLPGLPPEWGIDSLKLALVLRVADACHIDSRRAPALLRALLRPDGFAEQHWIAQQHLLTPRRDREQLDFSAASPYRRDESKAWWIAYELATLADRELRSANEVLHRRGRKQFAARWVSGIDTPENFNRHVPSMGWKPVDTRLRVGDIPRLVASLGGRNLYGNNGQVPLRELLQNARDAVVARRLIEKHPDDWGEIVVRQGQEGKNHWIEVQDSGKGMSHELLTGAFLDFGGSYWGSRLAANECPGLFARGFNPAGRFGIGFFSVFMWGDRVTVRTRTPNDGKPDTRVLEFTRGPSEPPILRPASIEEQLNDAGTVVRVWLTGRPDGPGGPLAEGTPLYSGYGERTPCRKAKWAISDLCVWLCPALDVTLSVEEQGENKKVLFANDWLTIDSKSFLHRLHIGFESEFTQFFDSEYFQIVSENIQIIKDDHDRVVGRAVITPMRSPAGDGPFVRTDGGSVINLKHPVQRPTFVVTAGSFRSETIIGMGMTGLVIGRPTGAARYGATAIGVRGPAVGAWASKQGQLLAKSGFSQEVLSEVVTFVQGCGGQPNGLPIARDKHRFLTPEDIASIQPIPEYVELFDEEWDPDGYDVQKHTLDSAHQYGVNRLDMQSAIVPFTDTKLAHRGPKDNKEWMRFRFSPLAANIEAWAKRWGVSIEEVLSFSTIDIPSKGIPDVSKPVILRRPNSSS